MKTKTTIGTFALLACTACSNLLGINEFGEENPDGGPNPNGDGDFVDGEGGSSSGGEGGTSGGTEAWAMSFGASKSDVGRSVMTTEDDEVIVAGVIGSVVNFGGGTVGEINTQQLFVTHLASNGDHRRSVASSGTAIVDLAGAVIDNTGNVLVAGSYRGGTLKVADDANNTAAHESRTDLTELSLDLFVAQLTPDGDGYLASWSTAIPAGGGVTDDDQLFIHDLASPGDGSVVVVGSMGGAITIGSNQLTSMDGEDVLIARIGSDGTPLWAHNYGDMSAQKATAVTIDESGAIWVAGTFEGVLDFTNGQSVMSNGSTDIFLARLNADTGAVEQSFRFGGGGRHTVDDIATPDGGVVLVGSFTQTTTFGGEELVVVDNAAAEDIFVVSLDRSGAHVWSRSFGGSSADFGRSVAIDSQGNLLVGASYSSEIQFADGMSRTAGGFDALVFKLAPDGATLWSTAFGRNEHDRVGGIAVDASDNVIATGQFVDGFVIGEDVVFGEGLEDVFVVKLNP